MRLVLPASQPDAPGGEDNGAPGENGGIGRGSGGDGAHVARRAGRAGSRAEHICNNVPRKT